MCGFCHNVWFTKFRKRGTVGEAYSPGHPRKAVGEVSVMQSDQGPGGGAGREEREEEREDGRGGARKGGRGHARARRSTYPGLGATRPSCRLQ
jgi:hypothetical protein